MARGTRHPSRPVVLKPADSGVAATGLLWTQSTVLSSTANPRQYYWLIG